MTLGSITEPSGFVDRRIAKHISPQNSLDCSKHVHNGLCSEYSTVQSPKNIKQRRQQRRRDFRAIALAVLRLLATSVPPSAFSSTSNL